MEVVDDRGPCSSQWTAEAEIGCAQAFRRRRVVQDGVVCAVPHEKLHVGFLLGIHVAHCLRRDVRRALLDGEAVLVVAVRAGVSRPLSFLLVFFDQSYFYFYIVIENVISRMIATD